MIRGVDYIATARAMNHDVGAGHFLGVRSSRFVLLLLRGLHFVGVA